MPTRLPPKGFRGRSQFEQVDEVGDLQNPHQALIDAQQTELDVALRETAMKVDQKIDTLRVDVGDFLEVQGDTNEFGLRLDGLNPQKEETHARGVETTAQTENQRILIVFLNDA